jgi:hypothetical protein
MQKPQGYLPPPSTPAWQPCLARRFQVLQALKQASVGPDARRAISNHIQRDSVLVCSNRILAMSVRSTCVLPSTGRQCGPPGWRGEFHQARDPSDHTSGGNPSRPARPSEARRARARRREGSLDGQP